MKKWMNRIGIGLLAAAVFAMVAGDLLAGEPSHPTQPTAQKFYLEFSTLAPTDINCDATGPGVRTHVSRNIVGKPILRITGNAADAQITCWRQDGSRYTTDLNRQVRYNTAQPVRALVSFVSGQDAMSVVLQRGTGDGLQDTVVPRAFIKVQG